MSTQQKFIINDPVADIFDNFITQTNSTLNDDGSQYVFNPTEHSLTWDDYRDYLNWQAKKHGKKAARKAK